MSTDITPPGGSYHYQAGESGNILVTEGTNTLTVNGGHLTVNGESYGLLQDGDSIQVDENGQVTVNGTPRWPE
jgi:hypothetical protein